MIENTSTADRAILLEALLFSEGGTLSKKKTASILGYPAEQLYQLVSELRAQLVGRGLTVIETDFDITLVASESASGFLKQYRLKELERDIGDSGLEVLSIILYRGPSTRTEIDYIRGVNTSSTVRTLAARGLIERVSNESDGREYRYHATAELFAHLGIQSAKDLPEYGKITSELAAFEKSNADQSPVHDEELSTEPTASSAQ